MLGARSSPGSHLRNFLLFLSIAKSRDPVAAPPPPQPAPGLYPLFVVMFFDQASEFSLFALDIVAVFAARLPASWEILLLFLPFFISAE